jgi:hypothetical protein
MHKRLFQFKTSKGTYTINTDDALGAVSFGKVFTGTDPFGRTVAIKIIEKEAFDTILETFGSVGGLIGAEIKALKLFN